MIERWQIIIGVGFFALVITIKLLPKLLYMIALRKERGLWGYDPKQFAEAEKRERDEA